MGQFVEQHEQHVAEYKFRESLKIFRRKALKLRIIAERAAASIMA
jgi:hypothetical protein